ncbi:killer toxin [Mycena olivaceomarginata]|jgi:hypothetical protein|nr:killer toxin [Mycena olivaceomarginata]
MIRTLVVLGVAILTSAVPTNVTDIIPPVPDLGINCRGSSYCLSACTIANTASVLVTNINAVSNGLWFNNGDHITCYGNICAFLQNTPEGGAYGSTIKGYAHYIPEHGCACCGSVPTGFPNDNNVADGQLTFNFVG